MHITTITFEKKRNLGDYNHELVSVSATLDEGANVANCMATVKQEVFHALGLAADPVAKPEPAKPEPAKPAKKEEAKKEEVKEEKPAPKKKPAAPKKPKTVAYNREEQSHKTEFAKVLASINPNWKKECANKAKDASVALTGKPMMDDKGKILPEFVEMVKEAIREDDL